MNKDNRVLLLLAAYDFESLHLTLQSLSHTVDEDERVVVILNGKRGIRSALVEDVAREWCAKGKNRHVVKPLNYGKDAYTSISQVISQFPLIKNAEFICKIDDDLIPLKKGWVDNLHRAYLQLEEQHGEIGFVTSLINNNAWGFKHLVKLFGKEAEYQAIMNFESHSGTGVVAAGKIADGRLGSVWQYPYLAKWVHEWTLCSIDEFIEKTASLGIEEVGLDTHYSIGCMFFRKELWLSLPVLRSSSNFDELLIHEYCQQFRLRKFAVMNEPMGHLFYHIQRNPNRLMIPRIKTCLTDYWKDSHFSYDFKFDEVTNLEIVLENHFSDSTDRLIKIDYDLEVVQKSSFYYKMRKAYRAGKKLFAKSKQENPKSNDPIPMPRQRHLKNVSLQKTVVNN